MLVQLDRMKKEYDGFSLELNMEIPENQIIGLIGATELERVRHLN